MNLVNSSLVFSWRTNDTNLAGFKTRILILMWRETFFPHPLFLLQLLLYRCDAAPCPSIPDIHNVPRGAGSRAGWHACRGPAANGESLRGARKTGFRWETRPNWRHSPGPCLVTSRDVVLSVLAQWRCAASSRCCCCWWWSWLCASTNRSPVAENLEERTSRIRDLGCRGDKAGFHPDTLTGQNRTISGLSDTESFATLGSLAVNGGSLSKMY